MCEWLSSEDWCDVRLLCGGRVLGAHRAVLASVSSFLRRLLLSCPVEEPTLIVLPDFDLEAMSAVLYYIYNGEVTISRQKLEKFLEIIKTMQIFIDRQYSSQFFVEEIDYNVKTNDETFALRTGNDTDDKHVTFRKSQRNVSQSSRCELDYAAPQNWNEQFKPCLGNLRDRQRDCFLRGSFMETYPRNCNANGGAGVPAIPSGSYHPTSSLTNANANGYLSSDDAFSPSSENTVDMSPNLNLANNYSFKENTSLGLQRSLPISVANVWESLPAQTTYELWQRSNERKHASYIDLSLINQSTHTSSYYKSKVLTDSPWYPSVDNNLGNRLNCRMSSQSKVAILNKALDNPWCPRLPSSFRPFRRKYHITNVTSVNDTNNNVQQDLKIKDEREPTDLQHNDRVPGSTCVEKESANDEVSPIIESTSSRSTRYACTECGKTFSQLRNFKYHMSVHRGTKEFAASCDVCGKSFNDRGYLSSHMKIHRNRKEYKCTQCPKSFNQRVAYNMHVRIHTGVKPHVCGQCGKAFSRKMLLKQHQRTHSGERPYACPHCDKRFADRSNMTLHLRLHTGIKPFKCPMCPKSFTKKHHLKSHVNFHTGAKPYSCPRCKLTFTQSSNMRTHLKRCTAPEPEANTT